MANSSVPSHDNLSSEQLRQQRKADVELLQRILPMIFPLKEETSTEAFRRLEVAYPEMAFLTADRIATAMEYITDILFELIICGRPEDDTDIVG